MIDWTQFLIPYSQAVEELKVKFKSIRKSYTGSEEYSPIEFVTGRVKKVSSIIEKLERRGMNVSEVRDLEDIAGLRIMCQLVEDIDTVVALIHARNGKDLTIVEERDYIKNMKESGYRSYHIIISYRVFTSLGEEEVLAEIQIRTLAMNFWATIEHSINYKFGNAMPEEVSVRLKKAADAAYRLDKEMSEIKDEIMDSQKLFISMSVLTENVLNKIHKLYDCYHYDITDLLKIDFYFAQRSGKIYDLQKLDEKVDKLLEEAKSSGK